MTTETVTTVFDIKANREGVEEVLKALTSVDSRTSALGQSAEEMGKASATASGLFLTTMQKTFQTLEKVKSTGGLGGLVKPNDIRKAETAMKGLADEFYVLTNLIELAESGMEGLEGDELIAAAMNAEVLYDQMNQLTETLDGIPVKWDKIITKQEEADNIAANMGVGQAYEQRLKDLKDQSAVDLAGDIASASSGLKGVAMTLQNQDIVNVFEVLEAGADFAEFLPKLGVQLSSIGTAFLEMGGPLAKMTTGLMSMGPAALAAIPGVAGLGAKIAVAAPMVAMLGAGIGSLALVLAPFAAILFAGGKAIEFINNRYKSHYDLMNQVLARTDEYYSLLATGNKIQVEDAIAAAEEAYAIAKAKSDETTVLVEGTYEAVAQGFGVFTDSMFEVMGLLKTQGFVQTRDLRYQNEENKKATTEAKLALDALVSVRDRERIAIRSTADTLGREATIYGSAITALKAGNVKDVLSDLTTAETARLDAQANVTYLEQERAKASGQMADELDKQIAAIKRSDLGPAEEQVRVLKETLSGFGVSTLEVTDAINDARYGTGELTEAEQQLKSARESATTNLQQLSKDYVQAETEYNEARSSTDGDRRLRDSRDQEDWDRQEFEEEAAHQENLLKIEEGAKQQIAEIREELAALPAEQNKESLALEKQYQEDKGQTETDYMKESLEAHEQFYREQSKIDSADKLQRLRHIEDTGRALRKAEFDNDVNAFMQTEEDSALELERMQEDADIRNTESTEQYLLETEERRVQFDEKMVELDTQLTLERTKLQEHYAQQVIDLNQRIADEVVAARAAIKAEEEQFALDQKKQDDERALRIKRQQEDDQLADKREKDNLDKQLAMINQRAQEEIKALQNIDNSSKQLGLSAKSGAAAMIELAAAISRLPKAGGMGRNDVKSDGSIGNDRKPSGTVTKRDRSGMAYANEGVATSPTIGMIGDNLYPGDAEAAIRFKMSDGIPARFMKDGGMSGGGVQVYVDGTFQVGDIADIGTVKVMIGDMAARIGDKVVEGIRNAKTPKGNAG